MIYRNLINENKLPGTDSYVCAAFIDGFLIFGSRCCGSIFRSGKYEQTNLKIQQVFGLMIEIGEWKNLIITEQR